MMNTSLHKLLIFMDKMFSSQSNNGHYLRVRPSGDSRKVYSKWELCMLLTCILLANTFCNDIDMIHYVFLRVQSTDGTDSQSLRAMLILTTYRNLWKAIQEIAITVNIMEKCTPSRNHISWSKLNRNKSLYKYSTPPQFYMMAYGLSNLCTRFRVLFRSRHTQTDERTNGRTDYR